MIRVDWRIEFFLLLVNRSWTVVYGEKEAGAFQRNARRKRAEHSTTYPFWREPYMMATEYTYFRRLEDLPGEGVIAMEFTKQ